MGFAVSVTISGDKETIAKLNRLKTSLVTLDRAMQTVGKELAGYFANQVFASQGGILGESWPQLSAAYLERKAELYPGRGPLVRTGAMKSSFTFESDKTSATIGNTADYFAYHQSTEPRTKIPRRAMMKVTPEVRTIVSKIIDADISKKLRQAGF